MGSKAQAPITVFLLEVMPTEAKEEWIFTQAVFDDSGGPLHFLIIYFPVS